MTLDDTGWRSCGESQWSTPLGRGVAGRQAIKETSGAGPLDRGRPKSSPQGQIIFISRRRILASKCWFLMMIQESLLECRFISTYKV